MKNRKNHSKEKKNIDWKEVRSRIETSTKVFKSGIAPTIEGKKKILKERAKALAVEPEKEVRAEEYLHVLEFSLAYERYCIETSFIQEVYPLKELTPLSCTPNFVLGIINVRGKIFSVIDIKKFFDIPERGLTDLNKVIIINYDNIELGILADSIIGVRSIPLEDIQPSIPTLTGIREEYLRGVTKERMVILDAFRLLSDKKIIVHEEV